MRNAQSTKNAGTPYFSQQRVERDSPGASVAAIVEKAGPLLPCRRPTWHGTQLQRRCVVTRDIPKGSARNVEDAMHTGLRRKGRNERLQLEHCKHTCLLLHLKNHRRILVLCDVIARHGVALGQVGVGQLVLSGVQGQHGTEC